MKNTLKFLCLGLVGLSLQASATPPPKLYLMVRTVGTPGHYELRMRCDITISSDQPILSATACYANGCEAPLEHSQGDLVNLVGGIVQFHSSVYGGRDEIRVQVTPGGSITLSASCVLANGQTETIVAKTKQAVPGKYGKAFEFMANETGIKAWLRETL